MKSDYFDYKDQITEMNISNQSNLNNDDANSEETPFFDHTTARVSIFEDDGQSQSAFNIFNNEPRESKQKSLISKLQIFERDNGDTEEKNCSFTPVANQFIPMTGGRQFYQRESRQNSKGKQLFQSRVRDTKDKEKPFYLKKQSLEKEKFTFRPLSSTNISFQAIHQRNQFQGPDSNISRKSSKDKEQIFHYMRADSSFNERPIVKKQEEKIMRKQTKEKDKEEPQSKQIKESSEKVKSSNINIKEKDQNQNVPKMNFILNLRKSKVQQKESGFKVSSENVFKDYKPIKPSTPLPSFLNKKQEIPCKKIEEISPKCNIKQVQNISKTVTGFGFGESTKKPMLDTNPSKTEKKLPQTNPDNPYLKTSVNFNKLPSLVSSRVRALTIDGSPSDSSSNQSLPKDKAQNQITKADEIKNRKEEQISESIKKDNKGFVLGLKDKLKAFGGPSQKMQMKSIVNSKGFQFKTNNIFAKQSGKELPQSTKQEFQPQSKYLIMPEPKFNLKQKETKSNIVPEVPKRESKFQTSFTANKSDFSKYMVQVTVLLVEGEKLKVRCNRTKNAFRELVILSSSINQKINKVIQTN